MRIRYNKNLPSSDHSSEAKVSRPIGERLQPARIAKIEILVAIQLSINGWQWIFAPRYWPQRVLHQQPGNRWGNFGLVSFIGKDIVTQNTNNVGQKCIFLGLLGRRSSRHWHYEIVPILNYQANSPSLTQTVIEYCRALIIAPAPQTRGHHLRFQSLASFTCVAAEKSTVNGQ